MSDVYKQRSARQEILEKTNYDSRREAIEECLQNTPFCGGELGDFDTNVETTYERIGTVMFKDILTNSNTV